ncbi:MAG TPA: ATP-dependent helicase, partial [Blastocatellia bacterium]
MSQPIAAGSIILEKGKWKLSLRPHARIMLLRLFAKASKYDEGPVTLQDTLENCRNIAWFMSRFPLTISEEHKTHLAKRSVEQREMERGVQDLLAGYSPPLAFPLAIPARDYQMVAATLAYQAKGRGLLIADPVGLGKTVEAICPLTMEDT